MIASEILSYARVALLFLVTPVDGSSSFGRGAASQSISPCSRQCLRTLADRYLESLVAHDPSRLPFAPLVTFTENGRELKLGDGLWKTAAALGTYRVYVLDPDSGAVAVQTVLYDGPEVVQLLLRLRIRDDRITEVETLIAREGDTCCWAPERLAALSAVFEQTIPIGRRAVRQELIAIADAYFTALHTGGTPEYRRASMFSEMNRYENGLLTTNVTGGNRITRWDAAKQLDSAMFGLLRVVNRRYPVVDPEKGTLLAVVLFQRPDSRQPPTIISEFFKITDGKIYEIRAVMVSTLPRAQVALRQSALNGGADSVVARYCEMKTREADAWLFDEYQLNTVGYWFLERGRKSDAVLTFQLNVNEYPNASNPYDSLGEAYLSVGDTSAAILAYERSVQLDPKNNNGAEVLRQLRGKTAAPSTMRTMSSDEIRRAIAQVRCSS
jgi:tetratricopeptide (TPR) repeat protein